MKTIRKNNLALLETTVAIVRCPDYNPENLQQAISRLAQLLRLDFSRVNSPILLKPNMLSARSPQEAVTTHPHLLLALGKLLASPILIGDSPANSARPVEDYWQDCGLKEVASRLNARLVKFDQPVFVSLRVKKKLIDVPLAAASQKWPIINLPKLKTHSLTLITAAVKNLYGCIPGFKKSLLHSQFVSPQDFCWLLLELYRKIERNVLLHLVDAITIMDGKGPSAGRVRPGGYLIAGVDGIAVDMVCAELLGLKPVQVPHLHLWNQFYSLPQVTVTGDSLVALRDVDLPGVTFPLQLLKFPFFNQLFSVLRPFFSIFPEIDQKSCQQCLACVQVCPVKAILKPPDICLSRCIRCLCCFEVCPYRAIRLRKSFLAKCLT
ncbi:MAG: DUF362 domain-containing protein [Candidatus Omnitrophica bacterium]|nr:DUF362 domain-containing protein [Candidatus Omnitrophota bacterium]